MEGFLLLFKDREWAKDAACKGMDTEFFFPGKGCSPAQIKKIRTICGGCPVQDKCLEYGYYETHGWWGGYAVRERQNSRTSGQFAR